MRKEKEKTEEYETARKLYDKKKAVHLKELLKIKENFTREKARFQKIIDAKDEQIKTLRVRLSWRKDRIDAEFAQRKKKIEERV